MKPFRYNLELVIKKYVCSLHDLFPGVDYSSNDQVLSGMSNYIYSYNYISIFFIVYLYFTQMISEIKINLYSWSHSTDESDREEYM